MRRFIQARDNRLMLRVNQWRPPRWFRLWMIAATRGGDGWLWYSVGIVILILGGPNRFRAIAAACLATAAGTAVFVAMKLKFRRKRPSAFGPHAWATLLPPDQFSFPSGHTITACAMATVFSSFYPSYWMLFAFFAVSIGASRIILGMHFLSDVLAGALIGWLIGYAAVRLFT